MATAITSRAASAAFTASHLIPKSRTLPPGSLTGIVVSAGRMDRTVKVRTTKQKFNSYLKRHYNEHPTYMVADPADSLREGDVVRFALYAKTKKVRHVVTNLMVPFGTPAEERAPVTDFEELVKSKRERKAGKWERRVARRKAAARGEEGVEVRGEGGESDFTGKKIDGLRREGVELEGEAERIKEEAEQEGIDLNKRMEGVKL